VPRSSGIAVADGDEYMFLPNVTPFAQSAETTRLIYNIASVAAIVFSVAGLWGVFRKAGKPGWAALIPIYNLIVLQQVIGKAWWWGLLLLIPCVGIVVWILVSIELAKVFGKGTGYTVGLILLGFMFLLLLGFGDAKYRGPVTV
jgi:hypothetical protein